MNSVTMFHAPTRLPEALELLGSLGPDARPLAGGTDLGVQLRRGVVAPTSLVSLVCIPELRRLTADSTEVVLGACVTHREIERSPLFDHGLTALREACATVGGVQTRNAGTIAGNLASASPAADTPPVLMAFHASVDVSGVDGTRSVALDDFFLGYRRTALTAAELVTAVRIPSPGPAAGSAFEKLGRRHAMEISISCAAAFLELGQDGVTCTQAGVGLGSVSPTTVRATAAESLLRGQQLTDEVLMAAAEAAAAECSPVDDIRGSAAYRRRVTRVLVHRALSRAMLRAQRALKGAGR